MSSQDDINRFESMVQDQVVIDILVGESNQDTIMHLFTAGPALLSGWPPDNTLLEVTFHFFPRSILFYPLVTLRTWSQQTYQNARELPHKWRRSLGPTVPDKPFSITSNHEIRRTDPALLVIYGIAFQWLLSTQQAMPDSKDDVLTKMISRFAAFIDQTVKSAR